MGFRFEASGSRRAYNDQTPQVLAYPFTVGCWVKPLVNVTGVKHIWSFADTASANNYWSLAQNAATSFRVDAAAGGTVNSASALAVPAVGVWFFILVRCISATNRKISVLPANGLAVAHGTTATSRAPAGVDNNTLGALGHNAPTAFWDGDLAECWYTLTDIQSDGAQINDGRLRSLAYRGPFADPVVCRDIVEYRALRSTGLLIQQGSATTGTSGDGWREVYTRKGTPRIVWNEGGNYLLGTHPPLPGNYMRKPFARPTLIPA